MTETTATPPARADAPAAEASPASFSGVVEMIVRLAVLFAVVAWCLQIVAPFLGIVLWAIIIAIAVDSPYQRLSKALGGRETLAATLFVVLALTMLVVPAVLLSETLVTGAQRFAADVASGKLAVPPAPDKVADWPIVGDRLYEAWHLANENLGAALEKLGPQLQTLSAGLLRAAGAAGVAMLQLAASLVISGFLLANTAGRSAALNRIAERLAGPRGGELVGLAYGTIQSVVQGIVGVAVTQALLAGAGLMLADVPAAGLWALLVLIAAIVQLPVALVMVPPVIIVFSTESTMVAAAFAGWALFVSLIDNVLKPLLFGRGVKLPTIVIFLGAIGGMLTMGIIGLFLGAVVLAVGYTLFMVWFDEAGSGASSEEVAAASP